METTQGNVTPARSFREREHRYGKLQVKDLLTVRLSDLGLRNSDVQAALDYSAPNVIAMIKGGTMRLPENKVVEAADVLQIDRSFLLRKVMLENNPKLWDVIERVMGNKIITDKEYALVTLVRETLDGHEIDLTKHEFFRQTLVDAVKAVAEIEVAHLQAAKDRIKKDK